MSTEDKENHQDAISHAYLVDAKAQYTDTLLDCIVPRIYEGFAELFSAAKQRSEDDSEVIATYQQMLKAIPNWNQSIIDEEYNRILEASDCKDYFEDLLSAIFLVTIKILTHVQFANSKSNLDVEIPNAKSFVHGCYVNSARQIFNNPYLFDNREDRVPVLNQKKNYCFALDMIKDAIRETLRKAVPVQDIVQHSLLQDDDEDAIAEVSEAKNEAQKKLQAKMLQAKVAEFKLKAMQDMNLDEEEYNRLVGKQIGGGDSDKEDEIDDEDFDAFKDDDDEEKEDRNINIYPHSKTEARQLKSLNLFDDSQLQSSDTSSQQQPSVSQQADQSQLNAHTSNGQQVSIPSEVSNPTPNVSVAQNSTSSMHNPFNVPPPVSINPNSNNNVSQNFDNSGSNTATNDDDDDDDMNLFDDADDADSD